MANALADGEPIIYCNERFCQMVGFSRAEVMQKPAVAEFLHGPLTSPGSITLVRETLAGAEEKQIDILYYRKDGNYFVYIKRYIYIEPEKSGLIISPLTRFPLVCSVES